MWCLHSTSYDPKEPQTIAILVIVVWAHIIRIIFLTVCLGEENLSDDAKHQID